MKLFSIIIMILLLALNSFSQRVDYFVGVGSNYTVFNSYYKDGNFGGQIFTDASLKLKKHFSIKTGFGIKQVNTQIDYNRTAGMKYFTGNNLVVEYNDRQPFIIPNSVVPIHDSDSTIIGYEENTMSIINIDTINNHTSFSYNLLLLNIPLLLQFDLFKQKFLLSVGLSGSALIFAKNTVKSNNDVDFSYVATKEFRTLNANFDIGVKYKIFNNIYAGLSYENSISNIFKEKKYVYIKSFSLNLSYKL